MIVYNSLNGTSSVSLINQKYNIMVDNTKLRLIRD